MSLPPQDTYEWLWALFNLIKLQHLFEVNKTGFYGEVTFMKWNLKINMKHKPVPLVTGSNIVLKMIYAEVKQE